MKRRVRLPGQWVLPIVTAAIVLMAIILPERISSWGDRTLFAAAHVEEFDGTLGIVGPELSLSQRIRVLAALNFGETTDAYIRYEDSFTNEEWAENDRLYLSVAETLMESGILPLPKGLSLTDMVCNHSTRLLLWDSVTMEQVSFLQIYCYEDCYNCGMDLTIDEQSGLPVLLALYHPEMEARFPGDDGRELVELGTEFVELLGFIVSTVEYGADDAYLSIETEDGTLEYHISQKYDVLCIEAMPDTPVSLEKYDADYETSVSVSINGMEAVYIK